MVVRLVPTIGIFEDPSQENNFVFSLYAPTTIPRLVTCFKFLILPTEKNFITFGAIVSRLKVAVEYLSKSNQLSMNKNKKQLPSPVSEKVLSTITNTTSNKRLTSIPDVTIQRFCQLMLVNIHHLSIRLWRYSFERTREFCTRDFRLFNKLPIL